MGRRGRRTDIAFKELVDKTMDVTLTCSDLHISRAREGELFITRARTAGFARSFP